MKLSDLLKFNPIVVQCHDNPDADAIASGYALYSYFKNMGKDVRLIYSGRAAVSKSNLLLLIDYLEILDCFEYIPDNESFACKFCRDASESDEIFKGLLVTEC